MEVTCKYNNGTTCGAELVENVMFYLSKIYPRSTPYTVDEYALNNITGVVSTLAISVVDGGEAFDPRTI